MQKIVIDNFGPVKHAEIEIKPLLVLIGEQATGKSTIAKLIYFFKTLSEDFRKHYYGLDYEPKFDAFVSELHHVISEKYIVYFGSLYFDSNAYVKFYYDNDKSIAFRGELGMAINIDISDAFLNKEIISHLALVKRGLSSIRTYKSDDSNLYEMIMDKHQMEYSDALTLFIDKLFCNNYNDFSYVIAGRNATISYSDFYDGILKASLSRLETTGSRLDYTKTQTLDEILMIDFLERVSRNRRLLNKAGDFSRIALNEQNKEKNITLRNAELLIDKILKGKYAPDIEEKIYVEDGSWIFLRNASSGQQESIRILQDAFLSISSDKKVFRVIEEPEAHIFPEAQMYLLQLLAILLNNTENNQLIITTHSPYVLTVINNLMHAYNVGQKNPEKVREIVNEHSWIDPKKVNAYMLTIANGAERIIDDEVNMIDAEKIDGVSEKLNEDYDKLLDIEYGNGEEK